MFNGFFNCNLIRLKFISSNPVKSRLKKKSLNIHKNFNPDITHNNKDNFLTQSHKSWLKTISQILSIKKINIKLDKEKTTHQCIKWNQRHSINNKIGWKIWIRTSSVLGMTHSEYKKFYSKNLIRVSKMNKMDHN